MEALKARVEDMEFIPSAMQRLVLGSTTLTTGTTLTHQSITRHLSFTHLHYAFIATACSSDMQVVRHVLGLACGKPDGKRYWVPTLC